MASGNLPINQISWVEIPATDLSRAEAFYSTVFKWTCTASPEMPDTVMFTSGPSHGCFIKVADEHLLSPATHPDNAGKKRVAVRVTITVESGDETMKEVLKAGGKLYKEKEIIPADMGAVVYFTDTENNVMGLWSLK